MNIKNKLTPIVFLLFFILQHSPNALLADTSHKEVIDLAKKKKNWVQPIYTHREDKNTLKLIKRKVPKSHNAYHITNDLRESIIEGLRPHKTPTRGFRILVLNCDTGWLCHTLAARQKRTEKVSSDKQRKRIHGVDPGLLNVKIAKKLKRIEKNHCTFQQADINLSYLSRIKPNDYEIIIALNLESIFTKHSQDWAKQFIALLSQKARIIFTEIAHQKTRKTPEYFSLCSNHKVSNISPKASASNPNPRSLYKLLQRKFIIDGKPFRADQTITEFRACKQRISRMGNNIYIKEYLKDPRTNLFLYKDRAEREIAFYQYAKQHDFDFIPQMRAYEITEERIILAVDRVPGKQVLQAYPELSEANKKKLMASLLKAMTKLDKHKITHGDFSTKNMIWNEEEEKVYLIDFDSTFIGIPQSVRRMLPLFEELRRNHLMPRNDRHPLAEKGIRPDNFQGFTRNLIKRIISGKAKNHKDLLRILS